MFKQQSSVRLIGKLGTSVRELHWASKVLCKKTALLALLLSLTACGGSGSSVSNDVNTGIGNGGGTGAGNGGGNGNGNGSANTPPEFIVSIESSPEFLLENSSASIVLKVAGAQGDIKISAESVQSTLVPITSSYTIVDDVITYALTAAEATYHGEEVAIEFMVSDQGRSFNFKHIYPLKNLSGERLYQQLSDAKSDIPNFLMLRPEANLLQHLSILVSLFNVEHQASVASIQIRMDELITESQPSSSLNEWLFITSDILVRYIEQLEAEDQLLMQLNKLPNTLLERSSAASGLIQEAIALSVGFVPSMVLGGVYVDDNGTLSQFVGNTNLGQYSDGQWHFYDDFAFLTPIVYPEIQQCLVD